MNDQKRWASRTRPALWLATGLGLGLLAGGGLQPARAQKDDDLAAKSAALEARIAALESKLQHFSRKGNDVCITGANLYIVNGAGATGTINGLGNLIVGYNELRDDESNARTGSHNLIVGTRNNFSSYGGVVFGTQNHSGGTYATVLGGAGNNSTGHASSVAGGGQNGASGQFSVISGGCNNRATGQYSSVQAGQSNTAGANFAAVSGGKERKAGGEHCWVAGDIVQNN